MSNSHDYRLSIDMRAIVKAMMEADGRDFNRCEQCGAEGFTEIHHKRYRGATYYDLELVCRSCNRLAKNKNLA